MGTGTSTKWTIGLYSMLNESKLHGEKETVL
jgi:hypothetical protein